MWRNYQKCAVPGCGHRYDLHPNVKYFRFSRNDNKCLTWLKLINNGDLNGLSLRSLRSCYSVCERHFDVKQFQTPLCLKLNTNAVPTLHLSRIKNEEGDGDGIGHGDIFTHGYDVGEDSVSKFQLRTGTCSEQKTKVTMAEGCFDRESRRHRFPKDKDFMQKWIRNVNNRALEETDPERIYNRYYVCRRHFADKYIVPGTKRGLSAVAVPTMFLPRPSEETSTITKNAISFIENVLEGKSLATARSEVEKKKEVSLINTELIQTFTEDTGICESIDVKEIVNPSEVTLDLPEALVEPQKPWNSDYSDEAKTLLVRCRLCLLNPGKYVIAEENLLSEQIFDYVRIELVETPNYPPAICICCKTIMDTIQSFVDKAHKANLKLKNVLTNMNNTVEETFKTDTPETFNESTECQPPAEDSQQLNPPITEETYNASIGRKYKCEFCDQRFLLITQYRRHKRMHSILYVCNKKGCGHTFSLEKNFKRHLQYHTRQKLNYNLALKHKKYTCQVCEKCFVSFKLLKQHRESHVNIKCPIDDCKTISKNLRSYDAHMLVHSERKLHLCPVCGKTFNSRTHLYNHERLHRGIRYKCDICNVGYSSKATLSVHMQVKHEGVRFYCSMCPNSYATMLGLRCHEKGHAGIKDFNCSLCPKSFFYKKNLVKHMQLHQGVRPYQCQICFKSYVSKCTLQCHEKIHSGEKFICTVDGCNKLLSRIDRLRKHIKTAHPEPCNVNDHS